MSQTDIIVPTTLDSLNLEEMKNIDNVQDGLQDFISTLPQELRVGSDHEDDDEEDDFDEAQLAAANQEQQAVEQQQQQQEEEEEINLGDEQIAGKINARPGSTSFSRSFSEADSAAIAAMNFPAENIKFSSTMHSSFSTPNSPTSLAVAPKALRIIGEEQQALARSKALMKLGLTESSYQEGSKLFKIRQHSMMETSSSADDTSLKSSASSPASSSAANSKISRGVAVKSLKFLTKLSVSSKSNKSSSPNAVSGSNSMNASSKAMNLLGVSQNEMDDQISKSLGSL